MRRSCFRKNPELAFEILDRRENSVSVSHACATLADLPTGGRSTGRRTDGSRQKCADTSFERSMDKPVEGCDTGMLWPTFAAWAVLFSPSSPAIVTESARRFVTRSLISALNRRSEVCRFLESQHLAEFGLAICTPAIREAVFPSVRPAFRSSHRADMEA